MKLIIVLLTTAVLQLSAAGFAQRVTLNLNKAPLATAFKEIRKQTGYDFFYTDALLSNAKPVNIHVKDLELKEALELCLARQALSFTIENNIIVIHQKPVEIEPVVKQEVKVIAGKVVDEDNKFLPGVTLKIKGNPRSQTITNENGQFSITVPDERAVLQFSCVGFISREIAVDHMKSPFTVVLRVDVSDLDQVQVIAYGTTTKRLNTGDVTTVTAAEIAKNPVNNVLEAIQGKVPGLFIQQVTGQPGGAFTLRLRGAANFSSGSPQPLIVVDGVRYPGATLPMSTNTSYGTQTFLQGGNGLNYLNPNDIESISVLKDADATALYGSSGAYGVVLITTKKAKPGRATLNANVYSGISVLGQTAPLLNTQQYLMLRREALKNDGTVAGASDKDINGTWPEDRYNDFRKDLLGSYAQTSNLNLTYSGGTQSSNYLVSGSLRNNGNIQRHKGASNDGSLRFSLNTNTADNKVSFALSGTYLSSTSDMVPTDFSQSVALSAPNAPPLFLPDGSINWSEGSNDLADDINRIYKNVTNNMLANGLLTYRPLKNLTLRANLSYNNISSNEFMGYPTTTKAPTYTNAAAETHSLFHHYEVRTITVEPYAEYGRTFLGKGDFNFKIGGKIDNKLSTFDEIHGVGFASDALLSNPSVGTTVTTSFGQTPYRDLGAYAIMKLIWDQKYIINLNGRRDGSTRFGSGRKFGNFGSVAVAWIFSEEKFIKNKLPFFSYGKLRASTGVIGGDAVGDFAYLSTYSALSGTYSGKTGLTPGGLANPLLSWEKNKDSEIGLELGFLNERLYIEGNYYRNLATNQLIGEPLPGITGFGSMPVNSDATIRTNGWEMSLSTTNIRAKNFSWSTRFNISIPKSKLVKLPTKTTLNANYVLDKPVTGLLLYKYAGINPQTGYFSFTNAKGVTADYNSGLTDADKTEFSDMAPRYYGGFQNSFKYKQLTLDVTFNYTNRLGRNMLSQTGFPFGYNGINGGTVWLNRWQNPGDLTDVPRVSANIANWSRFLNYYVNSTGAYSNATYARLQNVSLRYSVKGKFLSATHLKDLSVYLQGQNLLTISKYGGLDPENLNAAIIPPMRVFTAGLNVTF